ncbi:hypothetical protein E8E14_006332 [Neopestalotiopsis sp. 37M]|nr:hypothetical protein E8E14_006332 [Neopestalotiopsis sp. 37M]
MDEPHDFISTGPELFHKDSKLFEWLVFGKPQLGEIYMKLFHSWKDSDEHAHVDRDPFEYLYRTVIGLLYLAVIIGPVGILLLVPLSREQSFAIVTSFSTVVVIVLSLRLPSFYSAFVAFTTYIAIQITSFSILYQAGSNQPPFTSST